MKQLNQLALDALRSRDVQLPGYARSGVRTGVVHFGPGAFHRVHQACYLDDALARDPRWGVAEVSLHSAAVRDALAPQDGLYAVAVLDAAPSFRVIGAITELLVAPESPAAVLKRLGDPDVALITATVTEKGYCLAADGSLDLRHPEIVHDLSHPHAPRSLIGYLTAGLERRQTQRVAPPNVVSCDNLTDNGGRLRSAVVQFAQQRDAGLARWIEEEVAFPCTMVDSITPATDDALRTRVAAHLGIEDRWPVQRESFLQWVVEDSMRGPTPDWASIGVTITNDVAGFERAKLRLLNGAHSSLAYLGLLAGRETVAEAMRDPALAEFIERLMYEDIAPGIAAPRGLDVSGYIESILQRFRNPSIRHLLSQIAWDGSQKLPIRLLGTISDALAAGRSIDRLCISIAAWFHFIRRKAADGERVNDPLAELLFDVGAAATGEARNDVNAFVSLEKIFPRSLAREPAFVTGLASAYQSLSTGNYRTPA
ncbi:MAG: mannitol dehydrogenase family protein [Steroidobacter sp.]